MTDNELDELFRRHTGGSADEFRAAAREVVDAETKRLVDALREFLKRTIGPRSGWAHVREAARIVAEYDARQQKGPTP